MHCSMIVIAHCLTVDLLTVAKGVARGTWPPLPFSKAGLEGFC